PFTPLNLSCRRPFSMRPAAGPDTWHRSRVSGTRGRSSMTSPFKEPEMTKTKLLTLALLGALGASHAASAQEFDDRWYVAGSVGFNLQDEDRRTDDAYALGLGLGKFISPEWSVEGALNYQNPGFNHNSDLLWSQYGVSVDFRRHFIAEGRNWAPYLLAGVGYQRSEEEYVLASSSELFQREEGNLAAKLGVGLQGDFSSRVAVRAELAARFDFDDQSIAAETG